MSAPRYKLAIFDLDGTLADSFPWFLTVVNSIARKYGFREIADSDIDSLRRAGSREILKRMEVPLWKLPMVARHMRAIKNAHIGDIPLFPGVSDMLHGLTYNDVRIGLVTSDSEENARRQLGANNTRMISYFDCGASMFGKAKKFRRMISTAGIVPSETIAIGDEVRDIETARAAGLAFGAVSWGYAHPDALRTLNPELFFERIDQIAPALAKFASPIS